MIAQDPGCKRCGGWGAIVHSKTTAEMQAERDAAYDRGDHVAYYQLLMIRGSYLKLPCPACCSVELVA